MIKVTKSWWNSIMVRTLATYWYESLIQDGKQNSTSMEVLDQPQKNLEMELLNHIAVLEYHPTGSKYICNPPVLDTDEDWVVLVVPELRKEFHQYLFANGFDFNNYNDYAGMTGSREFTSWRHQDRLFNGDQRNLIVTYNPEWYRLMIEATEVAKEENLLKKEDRIACFEMIMGKYRKNSRREEWTFDIKTPQSSTTQAFSPWETLKTDPGLLTRLSKTLKNYW